MVSMFEKPIYGRVFQVNFDDLQGKPIADVPGWALGLWVRDRLFSCKTYLLVKCETDKKLYWVEKGQFTAAQ